MNEYTQQILVQRESTTYGGNTADEAELSLVVDRVAGRAVGALDQRRALVERLQAGAVEAERVALVVVNGVFVPALLLALLKYLLGLRAGVRILLAVHIRQLKQTAGERRGINKILEKSKKKESLMLIELREENILTLFLNALAIAVFKANIR